MRIREIKNSKLAKMLNVEGITLYPFIFYAHEEPTDDLRYHELTHVLQIQVCGFLLFYIDYMVQYIWGRLLCKSHFEAYMSIDYEKEAYRQQDMYLTDIYKRHLLTERLKAVGMEIGKEEA